MKRRTNEVEDEEERTEISFNATQSMQILGDL